MSFQLAPQLIFKWFDDNNNPASGWLVTTFEAGTTTPTTTWSDDQGTTPNDNPIKLDSRGEARIYLSTDVVYKFQITDPLGGNVQTFDNITGVGGVFDGGGGSPEGAIGDLQLNKNGSEFGASGLNWVNGVLTITNDGNGSQVVDFSDPSKVVTTTTYDTGILEDTVSSGVAQTDYIGGAGTLSVLSDATRQSITMDNVSILSDSSSVFGLGVVVGESVGLVDGSIDYSSDVFRFRENGVTRGFNALSITYDNSTSGLVANEVQGALDELKDEIDNSSISPAGATTEIQVNVGGAFGAYDTLTYDGSKLLVPQIGSDIWAEYVNKIYAKRITANNAGGVWNDRLLEVTQNDNTSNTVPVYITGTQDTDLIYVSHSGTGDSLNISHQGSSRAIYANSQSGPYSIYVEGGTTSSIYADKGITLGNNTTSTVNGTFRYTGSDAEVLKGGVWTSITTNSGTPAGSNTEIQFNNSGAFGASSSLTWDGSILDIGGDLGVTGLTASGDVLFNGATVDISTGVFTVSSGNGFSVNNAGEVTGTAINGVTGDFSGLLEADSLDIANDADVGGTFTADKGVFEGQAEQLITRASSLTGNPQLSFYQKTSFVAFIDYLDAGDVFRMRNQNGHTLLGGDGAFQLELSSGLVEISENTEVDGTLQVNGATNFGRLASAPIAGASGDYYYDTTENVPYYWNGTEWFQFAECNKPFIDLRTNLGVQHIVTQASVDEDFLGWITSQSEDTNDFSLNTNTGVYTYNGPDGLKFDGTLSCSGTANTTNLNATLKIYVDAGSGFQEVIQSAYPIEFDGANDRSGVQLTTAVLNNGDKLKVTIRGSKTGTITFGYMRKHVREVS